MDRLKSVLGWIGIAILVALLMFWNVQKDKFAPQQPKHPETTTAPATPEPFDDVPLPTGDNGSSVPVDPEGWGM